MILYHPTSKIWVRVDYYVPLDFLKVISTEEVPSRNLELDETHYMHRWEMLSLLVLLKVSYTVNLESKSQG